jgi:riboflavin kinase / FMN adenylyltransferase
VSVARSVDELTRQPRAVAIGTFDGVHLGHRRILEATVADGRAPTAVTFDPHPRAVLTDNQVELITSLDRRIELLEALGVADVLVIEFTRELAALEAERFVREYLEPIGAEAVFAGPGFRFGRGANGDLQLLERLGLDARPVPLVEGVSSTQIRQLLRAGEVGGAARLLGRPAEIEGVVVSGDARGGTLGFPTANLASPANVLVPAYGIYAGAAGEHRAAISIGVNPHYGGRERRIEAFLLDFAGDLYGGRLVVELWARVREERAFASEEELIAQIARDVEDTRAAERPSTAAFDR